MITSIAEAKEYLHKLFCQHLVAIGCVHRRVAEDGTPRSEWHNFLSSAFILCNGEDWYLATAGHCLKDLQKLCQRKDLDLYSPFFSDNFVLHPNPLPPLHFNIEERDIEFLDDDVKGIDLGLIRLNHLEVLAFKQSNRIPLRADKWMATPSVDIDCYFIAGASNEGSSVSEINGQTAVDIMTNTFALRPIEAQPTIIPEIPWTSFEVPDDSLSDISGMSGGPIFAVRQDGTQVRYWVVALQSQWNASKRIAFTCRLPEFSRIVEEMERKKRT
ncbi:hypothetical protein [Schlesneria sp.]|uniref:hypothetical protein n=1 Tax=Schlesneria sp. TaxID=2762018 RepID=UPI002EED3573